MNKDKIAKELNKYMQGIDKNLSVTEKDGYLDMSYFKGATTVSCGLKAKFMTISLDTKHINVFLKNDYLGKFYRKVIELTNKYDKNTDSCKYTVSLSKDSTTNYLNIDKITGDFFFSTNNDTDKVQAHFTESEIISMGNDPRFEAINFNNAFIKKVEE